eukprot:NODE_18741_length_879_cov_0.934840.p1 GENE.NODE_18741_length_879_cov_0.934840~~NODE_18741_length_879_cov_0.934840.p1  ORF type:complete len:264 (-),score=103.64 NODE_18741_length_879_cov_0.934840:86-787(-)
MPLGWGDALSRPLPPAAAVEAAAKGTATAAISKHFLRGGVPLLLAGAADAVAIAPKALEAACGGDAEVTISRAAPVRCTDPADGRLHFTTRLWQLLDYAEGRFPPLGPLCCAMPSHVWRAHSWQPWEETRPKLKDLTQWVLAPPFTLEALKGFRNISIPPALDVEPPGAVTRLQRAADGAHHLVVVLHGEKELLLLQPALAEALLAGCGTCDADQSACDPLEVTGRRPRCRRA